MDNIIGSRYNRLVIQKVEGKYKNGTKTFLCKCDCGGITVTSLNHLKRGEVKSCGCFNKEKITALGHSGKKQMIGKRFERLVVLSEDGQAKSGLFKWYCQCDCGNKTTVSGGNLRRGNVKSCGCLARELTIKRNNKTRNEDPWKIEFNIFKSIAQPRNLLVAITQKEFEKLVLSHCFYCGLEPKQQCKSIGLKELAIVKNGIDRKESTKGYVLENCIPCCFQCNVAKYTFSIDEFFNSTVRRFKHLKNKGLLKE